MPFTVRQIEPVAMSNRPGPSFLTDENPLERVTNSTLCQALRQLSSLLRHADTLFHQLETDCGAITERTVKLKARVTVMGEKAANLNARNVKIPVGDLGSFSKLRHHYKTEYELSDNLFVPGTRSLAVSRLYQSACQGDIEQVNRDEDFQLVCVPIFRGNNTSTRFKDMHIEAKRVEYYDDDGTQFYQPFEKRYQSLPRVQDSQMVAVDISGRKFDKMTEFRRSLRPEPSRKKRRGRDGRRHTLGGPGSRSKKSKTPEKRCKSVESRWDADISLDVGPGSSLGTTTIPDIDQSSVASSYLNKTMSDICVPPPPPENKSMEQMQKLRNMDSMLDTTRASSSNPFLDQSDSIACTQSDNQELSSLNPFLAGSKEGTPVVQATTKQSKAKKSLNPFLEESPEKEREDESYYESLFSLQRRQCHLVPQVIVTNCPPPRGVADGATTRAPAGRSGHPDGAFSASSGVWTNSIDSEEIHETTTEKAQEPRKYIFNDETPKVLLQRPKSSLSLGVVSEWSESGFEGEGEEETPALSHTRGRNDAKGGALASEEEEGVLPEGKIDLTEGEGDTLDEEKSIHSCDTEGYYTTFHDFDGFQEVVYRLQADDSLEQCFDGEHLTNHNNLPTIFDTFDGINPLINHGINELQGLTYNNSRESSEGLIYDRGLEGGLEGVSLVGSVEMRQKKERPTPPSRSSSLFKEQRESLDTVVHVSDLQIISSMDKSISSAADFSGPVADLATADTEKMYAAKKSADKRRSSLKREKIELVNRQIPPMTLVTPTPSDDDSRRSLSRQDKSFNDSSDTPNNSAKESATSDNSAIENSVTKNNAFKTIDMICEKEYKLNADTNESIKSAVSGNIFDTDDIAFVDDDEDVMEESNDVIADKFGAKKNVGNPIAKNAGNVRIGSDVNDHSNFVKKDDCTDVSEKGSVSDKCDEGAISITPDIVKPVKGAGIKDSSPQGSPLKKSDSPPASQRSRQEQSKSRQEHSNSSQQLPDMLTHTPDGNKGASPDRSLQHNEERRGVSTTTTISPHTILSPSTPTLGKGMNDEEWRKGNTNVSVVAQSTVKHCSGEFGKSANTNISDVTSEVLNDNTKQVKSTVVRNDSVNKKDVGNVNVVSTPKLRIQSPFSSYCTSSQQSRGGSVEDSPPPLSPPVVVTPPAYAPPPTYHQQWRKTDASNHSGQEQFQKSIIPLQSQSAVSKIAPGDNKSSNNSGIAMTKADSPKSERPRSSLGRSDSYRRAKPILSPPEARKSAKDKMAPSVITVHDLDISAIKVVDEKVKENSPPPIIGDDLLHQKPTNNFFKNIRSQFSFSSLRIKKSAKKSGSEPKSSKQQLGDSYRTSGCDPSNDLTPLASTTTKTPSSNGNGCLNGTGLNGVSPRNGGIGPKATSTPLSGCAGGQNGRSSTSPDADSGQTQAPPEMRRFRTAAVKNQYQRWSFAEQQMNHQQHPAANGHHYPPSAAVGPYYGGGQLYHHAVPPHQLYGTSHPYMVHNGHYNGQLPSHHIMPNGQVVAFTGHPAINGSFSGRPSPVNGQLGHHFGTYGPSSSRDSAGTRRSSLASLIGDGSIHSGSSGTNRSQTRSTPTPQLPAQRSGSSLSSQQQRSGSSLSSQQLPQQRSGSSLSSQPIYQQQQRPGSSLSTSSSMAANQQHPHLQQLPAAFQQPHHQPVYGSLRIKSGQAIGGNALGQDINVGQALGGKTVRPVSVRQGGCECPMCYHSIKNPCSSCGCPNSSISKGKSATTTIPMNTANNNITGSTAINITGSTATKGHVFKDANSTAAFFLSPSSDYYSLSPDSPPPGAHNTSTPPLTTPSATSTVTGDESPKNLSLNDSQDSSEGGSSPVKKAVNGGMEIQNFYVDGDNNRLNKSASPNSLIDKSEEQEIVDRKKRDTKVPPKIAKKPSFPAHVVSTDNNKADRRHSWAGDKNGPPANRPTSLHDFKKLLSQQPLATNSHRKSAKELLQSAEYHSQTPPPFNDGNAIVGGSLRKRNGWRNGDQRFSVIQEESEERKSRENLLE